MATIKTVAKCVALMILLQGMSAFAFPLVFAEVDNQTDLERYEAPFPGVFLVYVLKTLTPAGTRLVGTDEYVELVRKRCEKTTCPLGSVYKCNSQRKEFLFRFGTSHTCFEDFNTKYEFQMQCPSEVYVVPDPCHRNPRQQLRRKKTISRRRIVYEQKMPPREVGNSPITVYDYCQPNGTWLGPWVKVGDRTSSVEEHCRATSGSELPHPPPPTLTSHELTSTGSETSSAGATSGEPTPVVTPRVLQNIDVVDNNGPLMPTNVTAAAGSTVEAGPGGSGGGGSGGGSNRTVGMTTAAAADDDFVVPNEMTEVKRTYHEDVDVGAEPNADRVLELLTSIQKSVSKMKTLPKEKLKEYVSGVVRVIGRNRMFTASSSDFTRVTSFLDGIAQKVELESGDDTVRVASDTFTFAVARLQAGGGGNIETSLSFGSGQQTDVRGFNVDRSSSNDARFQTSIKLSLSADQLHSGSRVSFSASKAADLKPAKEPDDDAGGPDVPVVISEVILSATVFNVSRKLMKPVSLQFKIKKLSDDDEQGGERVCAFWDDRDSLAEHWSTDGVRVIDTVDDVIFCESDHLTSFAALFVRKDPNHVVLENQLLSLITVIGSALSIICQLVLIAVFLSVKTLREGGKFKRVFILINLAVALTLLNTAMIMSNIESLKSSAWWRQRISAALLGSLYSVMGWMTSDTVFLYLSVGHPLYARRSVTTRRLICSSIIFGYLVPAAAVVYLAVWQPQVFVREDRVCWIVEDWIVYLLYIPMLTILANNITMFLLIFYHIKIRPNGANPNAQSQQKRSFVFALNLFVMVGGSWLFGFALTDFEKSPRTTEIFAYIFTALTALQGVILLNIYLHKRKDVVMKYVHPIFTKFRRFSSNNNTPPTSSQQQPESGSSVSESRTPNRKQRSSVRERIS